jgi:hypothetical protein
VTALDPVSVPIQTSDLSHYYGLVNRQISLVTGWNLITLPIEPVTPYKAQSLLDAINTQGGVCSEIYRWVSGGWDIYIGGSGGNNFDISLGRGYFIRCSGASAWNFQGKMLLSGVSINFLSGWNLIGIPYPPGFYNAQTLLTALNSQGGACTEVYRWQSGGWDLFIGGSGGTPFAIEPNRGYFVRCSTSSSFSP